MADNINTNTMVGKVVAVCIALLFIVVLAFPIANSLGNIGKEDGGETITYTNEGIPFARADADTDEHIVVVELVNGRITVVTDGVPIDIGLGEPMSDYDSGLAIEYTIITTDNGVIKVDKGGNIGYEEYDNGGPGWIDIGFIYYEEEYSEYYYPATFTIHNGAVTFNEIGAEGVPVPGEEHTLGCKLYLSSDGDYVRGENVRVLSDSVIYVDELYSPSLDVTSEYRYLWVFAHGTTTILNWDNVSVSVYTTNSLDLTPALIVNSVNDGAYYTLQNVICPIEFDYESEHISTTHTLNGVYVPKTISYSNDNDTDSDGLGNVASTLIKLVPILLIVSLLLVFIVPMVYKPN